MILAAGTIIDRYQFEGVLGRGGMAMVYRARHRQLGTPVAIKVLTVDGTAIRDRLVQEGQIQASLVHPNVVRVFDVIQVGAAPGLVMELIEGPSLEEFLAQHALSLEQADAVATALLSGVGAAHARGLVHRDLKPGNVMMDLASGTIVPKVADFGLAKVIEGNPRQRALQTRTGVPMGTPAYMSPEQIRDAKNVDARTDVFALGAILYQLVTRRRAFDQRDILELFAAIGSGNFEPPRKLRPDIPDSMERAILGALKPERNERIADCPTLLRVWRGLDPPDAARSVSQSIEGPWPANFVASIRAISAAGAVARSQQAESDAAEDDAPYVAAAQTPVEAAPGSERGSASPSWNSAASSLGPVAGPAGETTPFGLSASRLSEPLPSAGPASALASSAPSNANRLRWTVLTAATLLSLALITVAYLAVPGLSDKAAGNEWSSTSAKPEAMVTAAISAPQSQARTATPAGTESADITAPVVRKVSAPTTAGRPADQFASAPPTPQITSIETAKPPTARVDAPAIPVPAGETDLTSTEAPSPSPPMPSSGPPEGMAFVDLAGDTESVWLVGSKNYRLPGNVPAGSYLIQAYFTPGKATPLKSITLTAGESRTIKCFAGLTQCN